MKKIFSLSDNNLNNPLVYTLSHSKNFLYKEAQSTQNNYIIVNKNTTNEECEKLIEDKKKLDIIFLIPKNLKHFFSASNLNFVFYPIRPSEILNLKTTERNKDYKNFNLLLRSDGFLTNKKNNKNVYLTETEVSIIALLFEKGVVERAFIKEKILNLHKSIDTKSLDSHLSRIRKKIRKINAMTEIISINHNKIKIDLIN
jgi:DNA-binding response OmpR family regulator